MPEPELNAESILVTTKLACSVTYDEPETDFIIITHINSVLSDLNQLGIGPADGFEVTDAESKWEDFYGTDKRLNSVRSYVYLRVRMLFDPPSTGPLMEAMNKQVDQLAWRINARREEEAWTTPTV